MEKFDRLYQKEASLHPNQNLEYEDSSSEEKEEEEKEEKKKKEEDGQEKWNL